MTLISCFIRLKLNPDRFPSRAPKRTIGFAPHPRHQLNRYDNLLSLLSYGVSLVDGIQSGRDAARAAIVDVPVQAPAPGTTQRSGLSRVRLANILFAGVNVLSKLWKGNRSRALIDLVASLGIFGGSKVAAKSWWSDFGREFGLKKNLQCGYRCREDKRTISPVRFWIPG